MPIKVVLLGIRKTDGIYLSIIRGYNYFHLSTNVRVPLVSIPMVSFGVCVSSIPIVTQPPVVSGSGNPTSPKVPLNMS